MSDNSRIKATKIIGQRKAFCMQRIPNLAVQGKKLLKEIAYIDFLVTSSNSDRKIIQSLRIISRLPSRISKWNQFRQFRRKPTKEIPIEKTQAGYISTMT